VLIGGDAKALDALQRLTGSGYQRVFAAVGPRLDRKSATVPPIVRDVVNR
jgi:hypothetical protein